MDDIEIRGRWKGGGQRGRRVVGRYIDPKQAFIDCKTAAALCIGGPCKYKVGPNSGITKAWLRANVAKGIADCFPPDNNIADVLGPVLLWACYDPVAKLKVPQNILTRVQEAYNLVRVLDPDVNPVMKVSIHCYRVADKVCPCPCVLCANQFILVLF
jgi:hypothetical protein